MKKLKLILTTAIVTLSTLTIFGQVLYPCDSTKAYWTFSKDNSFFAVKLIGDVKETDNESLITVNDYVLQAMVVDKEKYVVEGEDNSNTKVLTRYVINEAEYFSGLFKTKINLQMQLAPISAEQTVLIWFFEMPEGHNQEVKYQLFANIVLGDKIFGLSSSQFADQKLDKIKDFLMDVISTVKVLDNKKEFKKLCE